ncbi:MAG: proline--tRNA ligase [Myxococcota bacterium]
MRYSRAYIPTLKEVPKEATSPSHVLLLRAGYIRMVGAGIYEMLPLGLRVLQRIANIVREEMNRAGAQEMQMPALLPAEYYRESQRWESFGNILIRLQDRRQVDYCLGPTHEEIVTDLVRRDVRSYRQLPLNLYQIQTKFRDEPRPRAGLLRGREFVMKDAYSFDATEEDAEQSYAVMQEAYTRIFDRLGLDYRIVQADSGAMGGSKSAEFQVLAQTGEDAIVACSQCDYAANVEVASSQAEPELTDTDPDKVRPHQGSPSPKGAFKTKENTAESGLKRIHTPGKKTIADVADFLNHADCQNEEEASEHRDTKERWTAERCLKTLVYSTSDATVAVVLRGDHQLNELKLQRLLGTEMPSLTSAEEVRRISGAGPGSVGPVGLACRIIADREATRVPQACAGANQDDYHLLGLEFGRDWDAEVADLRNVQDGDPCPMCHSTLHTYRGIEGGHIFILGTHYSAKMNASFLDAKGEKHPFVMGCYGIGISRLMAAAVEQNHDDEGIIWPVPVAPFAAILLPVGKDQEVQRRAETLYDTLRSQQIEVLLDDRDERPGVKFKDADLLGIPFRLTLGARGLREGVLEVKHRSASDVVKIPLDECVTVLRRMIAESGWGCSDAE